MSNRSLVAVVLAFLVALGLAGGAAAQEAADDEQADGGPDATSILTQVKEKYGPGSRDFSFSPVAPPPQIEDDETREQYLAAWRAYYAYLEEGLDHRKRVFAWQHLSTRIIFFTVLTLVAAGILFSAIQFFRALRQDKGREPSEQPVTEFEATAKGIKVSSPVLGVIVLVISLVFFYLYLVHVYPIHETF